MSNVVNFEVYQEDEFQSALSAMEAGGLTYILTTKDGESYDVCFEVIDGMTPTSEALAAGLVVRRLMKTMPYFGEFLEEALSLDAVYTSGRPI